MIKITQADRDAARAWWYDEAPEGDPTEDLATHFARRRIAERDKIVAWLRSTATGDGVTDAAIDRLATAIEKGQRP